MIVRPLAAEEVPLVWPLAARAFDQLNLRRSREVRERPEATDRHWQRMHGHLHETGTTLGAFDGATLLGACLAYQRPHLWTLALLVVDPDTQSRGTGSALLRAGLATAGPQRLLHASDDERALRTYVRAGFRLLPALTARGTVDRDALGAAPAVLDVDLGEPLGPAEDVRVDLQHSLASGGRLLRLADGREGLCLVQGPATDRTVEVLSADDDATAADLLRGVLAVTPGPLELERLAPQEHWAVPVALDARLDVGVCGPVGVAGLREPLAGPVPPASVYA